MDFRLDQVYRQIPAASCPSGCGKCCGILFPSMAEIRNVKRWCGEHNLEYREFHMLAGLDCPYLSSRKECRIYSVRPFLCRLMGASVDLPCPLNRCRARKILNHSQSHSVYRQIYLKGKEKPRIERHRREFQQLLEMERIS